MPIPLGYSRSTFYGTLSGGEIFNWSLWMDQAPADNAAAQTQAQAFATKFQQLNDTPPASSVTPCQLVSNQATYVGCRVYGYTTNSGKATTIGDAVINRPGTSQTAVYLPNQVAVCVTLKSATAGRSATGRVYLPINSWTVQSNGQLSSSTPASIANWMAQFITALNTAAGAGRHIGVLSQKHGTFAPVVTTKVDSRLDIQRRRANRQTAVGTGIGAVA